MPQTAAPPGLSACAAQYSRDGFCLAPELIPEELLARVIPRMDAVIAGQYETGVAPRRAWNPGDGPTKIRKIDMPHLSDRTLFELVSHPEIGRWAAALTGAKRIQLWAAQLLYKPPGGEALGNVGWHQDKQYWPYWEGEVFTAWVAVSDVTEDAGPVHFVRGSQLWGQRGGGNFFEQDLDALRARIDGPEGRAWEEVPGILPPGGVSFHHCLTIHGSGPNLSAGPRRSFALHLRTERSRPAAGSSDYFVSHLDDPAYSPVLFET